MRSVVGVVGASSVALGVVSVAVGYRWEDPLLWAPDLVVGLVWVAAGLRFWTVRPVVAALAWGVGVSWFLASLAPVSVFWHRGLLIHLLLVLASPRKGTWFRVALVISYSASLVPLVWHGEGTTLVVACALLLVVAGPGRGRGDTPLARVSLSCLVVTLSVMIAGAVVRISAPPPGGGTLPTLLAYEAALAVVAVVLVATGLAGDSDSVAERVLELNDGPASSLRDALADVLEDPDLEVGYWRDHERGYTDLEGVAVAPPPPNGGRVALPIQSNGRPVALVVHDASLRGDPRLEAAVAVATRLVTANAELRERVNERRVELAASRLRLVQAADLERAHLAALLRLGPRARLTALLAALDDCPDPQSHLTAASARVRETLDDLGRWERGLHPRDLDEGLGPALTGLARASGIPVSVTFSGARLPPALETTIYYVCGEALANVTKHAAAEHVTVDVALLEGEVRFSVDDDGVGGADATGPGLRGARDRLEAFGGSLEVTSIPGEGSRLSGRVPLSLDPDPVRPATGAPG